VIEEIQASLDRAVPRVRDRRAIRDRLATLEALAPQVTKATPVRLASPELRAKLDQLARPEIPDQLDQLAEQARRALQVTSEILDLLVQPVTPVREAIRGWLEFPATLARRVQQAIKAPPEEQGRPVTLGVQAARAITEIRAVLDQLDRPGTTVPTVERVQQARRAILAQLEPLVLRVQAEQPVKRVTPDRPESPAPSEPDRPARLDRRDPPEARRATLGIPDLQAHSVTPEGLGRLASQATRDRLVREATQAIRGRSEMTGLLDQLVRQGIKELPESRATQAELVRRVISEQLVRQEMTDRRVLKELQETLETLDQQVKDQRDQLARLAAQAIRVPEETPETQAQQERVRRAILARQE
jgi:hypothetical protein